MKVNDSDKQRPSDGKILPDAQGHTTGGGDEGCGEKMKQHKFKIIGISLIVLIAIILGVTLSGGGDAPPKPKPGPGPGPGPNPIIPANTGFNPYYVDDTSVISEEKNKISGVLKFN